MYISVCLHLSISLSPSFVSLLSLSPSFSHSSSCSTAFPSLVFLAWSLFIGSGGDNNTDDNDDDVCAHVVCTYILTIRSGSLFIIQYSDANMAHGC